MDIKQFIKKENIIKILLHPLTEDESYIWVEGKKEETVVEKKRNWFWQEPTPYLKTTQHEFPEGFRKTHYIKNPYPYDINEKHYCIINKKVFHKPKINIVYVLGGEERNTYKLYETEESFYKDVEYLKSVLGENFIFF